MGGRGVREGLVFGAQSPPRSPPSSQPSCCHHLVPPAPEVLGQGGAVVAHGRQPSRRASLCLGPGRVLGECGGHLSLSSAAPASSSSHGDRAGRLRDLTSGSRLIE